MNIMNCTHCACWIMFPLVEDDCSHPMRERFPPPSKDWDASKCPGFRPIEGTIESNP